MEASYKSSFTSLLASAAICSLFSLAALTPLSAEAAVQKAQKADMFVESVGVATHLNWANSIYVSHFADVKAAMRELGIRYYRTDGGPNASNAAADLYNTLGIKGVFVVDAFNGKDKATGLKVGSADDVINTITSKTIAGVYAVEGPNEYNYSNRANWAAELRNYQLEIYNYIKHTPRLSGIVVGGPSLVTSAIEPFASRALGNMRDRVDVGVHHDYSYNGPTEARFSPSAQMLATNNYGPAPLITTETGVCTDVNLGAFCISERAQAKYIPRNLLDKFAQNPLNKSFIYEFVDQGTTNGNAEWDWGIVRSNFSRKPAFSALKNLIGLLNDNKQTNFVQGALDYTIFGDKYNIREVLVQKKDGRYYLMLWQAVKSYDNPTNKEINPSRRPLTLSFATAADIKVYEPTPIDGHNGVTPVKMANNAKSIALSIPDHVVVVEIAK